PELHACFGGTDRHATVGAALCGRPSLPRRGAPRIYRLQWELGIFIGDTETQRATMQRLVFRILHPPSSVFSVALWLRGSHGGVISASSMRPLAAMNA